MLQCTRVFVCSVEIEFFISLIIKYLKEKKWDLHKSSVKIKISLDRYFKNVSKEKENFFLPIISNQSTSNLLLLLIVQMSRRPSRRSFSSRSSDSAACHSTLWMQLSISRARRRNVTRSTSWSSILRPVGVYSLNPSTPKSSRWYKQLLFLPFYSLN